MDNRASTKLPGSVVQLSSPTIVQNRGEMVSLRDYYRDFGVGDTEPMVGKLAELLAEIVPDRFDPKESGISGNVSGFFSSVNVNPYIQFFSCDLSFEDDNESEGSVPAGLWIGALFYGGHETRFADRRVLFPGNGTPTMVSFGEETAHTECYRAHRPIRMSSYLVAKEFFDRSRVAAGETPLAALGSLITPGVHRHALPDPAVAAEALARLMHNPYQGQMARLFVESTVTASLFAVAQSFAGMLDGKSSSQCGRAVLAHEAKHVIDTQPEEFDSIISLATQLGTNETALQREFKAEIGQTIFQYVLQRRMQAARILIRDRHLAISQVAYQVGYNNPANFSTAYKRYFGRSPVQDRI